MTAVDEEIAPPDVVSNVADQILDWYGARGVDWHRVNEAASRAAKKAEWERKRVARETPVVVVSGSAPVTVAASGGKSVSHALDAPGSASGETSPATPASAPPIWDARDPSKRIYPGVAVAASVSTEDEGEVEETVMPVKVELHVRFFCFSVIFMVDPLYR